MKFTHRLVMWVSVGTILICSCLFVHNAFGADNYDKLFRDYKKVYTAQLRNKIFRLHKGDLVKLDLKDGKTVVGTFDGFVKAGDKILIMPLEGRSIFNDDDEYVVKELFDINLLVVKPI